MTVKVFWKHPYQTELTSTVTRISDNEVELSHTIFMLNPADKRAMQVRSTGFLSSVQLSLAHALFTL